jgi:hypothetical protein
MREVTVSLTVDVHPSSLDLALRAALGTHITGISTYGSNRPLSLWMDDAAVPADDAAAVTIANAHDPVFLNADTLQIPADGATAATITVYAPRSGAAAVSLLVAGTAVPVTLTGGVGTLAITSADPASIDISVQNPANRSTDLLTVEAR